MKDWPELWKTNNDFYHSLKFWEVFFKESVCNQKRFALKKRMEFTLSRDRLMDQASNMNQEADFKHYLFWENVNAD